jgi:hypothetical protein
MKTKKMGMELAVVVCACIAVGLVTSSSLAQKPFNERLKKAFGLDKEKNGNCHMCHLYDKEKGESPEKDNINGFGKELKAVPSMKPLLGKDDDYKFTPADLDIVEAAFKTIMDKDTDGDGASNGEEVALGTFPGDAKSMPDKAALEAYRKDHPKK